MIRSYKRIIKDIEDTIAADETSREFWRYTANTEEGKEAEKAKRAEEHYSAQLEKLYKLRRAI